MSLTAEGRPQPSQSGPGTPFFQRLILRRLARRLAVGVLLIAILVAAGGAAWHHVKEQRLRRLATWDAWNRAYFTAFINLANAAAALSGSVAGFSAGIGGDPALLDRAVAALEADSWLSVLGDLDRAVFGTPQPSFAVLLGERLWHAAWVAGFVRDRWRAGMVGPEDAAFLTALASELNALRSEAFSHARPEIAAFSVRALTAAQRSSMVAKATAVAELCRAYRLEGALTAGTRPAAVSAEGAAAIARRACGLEETAPATAVEFLDWWAGVHYWSVTVRRIWLDQHYGEFRELAELAWVDARSGEVLGIRPAALPQQEGLRISGLEAVELALKYASQLRSTSHVLLGYGQPDEGRWLVVLAPVRSGLVIYADPLEVDVSAYYETVIGHRGLTRALVPAGGPKTQFSATQAAEIGSVRLGRELGLPGPATVIESCPAVYRYPWGGTRAAWALTAETTESYRKPWLPEARDEPPARPGPSHLVVFIDRFSGEPLGQMRLWRDGGMVEDLSYYGFERK